MGRLPPPLGTTAHTVSTCLQCQFSTPAVDRCAQGSPSRREDDSVVGREGACNALGSEDEVSVSPALVLMIGSGCFYSIQHAPSSSDRPGRCQQVGTAVTGTPGRASTLYQAHSYL